MRGHPVFDDFKAYDGEAEPGFHIDFIGSRIDERFFGEANSPIGSSTIASQEYFEWIDILESVKAARGQFTFVELGAGYGRWSAIAAKAAAQKGIRNFRALLVEAEPVHARWAREHMKNNGITRFEIREVAVGGAKSKKLFVVSSLDKSSSNTPKEWYGQAFNGTDAWHHRPTNQTYEGRPLVDNGDSWGAIEVAVETLADLLKPYRRIDLIDMDIQGAEAEVVEASRELLDKRVKRLHIETHSEEVEARIRDVMMPLGWQKLWDFPTVSETKTPYGVIKFIDGVQSWINPRFARPPFLLKWFSRRGG